MIIKSITLKIHCASCSNLLFNKPIAVKIMDIAYLPFVKKAVKKLFPVMDNCKACGSKYLDKSYTYVHKEVLEFHDVNEHEKAIERCKGHIASTFDHNSDISYTDRAIIRESLQAQLQVLLNHKTVSA